MKITFLAGYFDAFGTYCDSLTSILNLKPGDGIGTRLDLPGNELPLIIDNIRKGIARAPDLFVYCGINGGPAKPADADLKALRSIAPTVMICPEASDRTWWWKLCADYERDETFDLIVNIDGNRDWPGSDKGLTLLMPVDPEPWGEPILWSNRYVECGFSGGNSNPYRKGMLDSLKDVVTWRGPDPDVDARKTYHGYRDFMKQTKVAFNMCQHGTVPHYDAHARHVKGRVIEAGLAGCALIDGAGPTADWFTPGVDYLAYANANEAREQIAWLKRDQELAQRMAASLRARVLAEHSPRAFWTQVFSEIERRTGVKAA